MSVPIKVFEHEYLGIGTKGFERKHWDALASFNARANSKYFTLYPEGIKFNRYVGVLQARNLTIEILPKADRKGYDDPSKDRWHKALLEMLRVCRFLKIDHPEHASLQLQHRSILDAYLDLFLREIELLMHQGLIKRYKKQDANLYALKGQLLFGQHVSRNMIHKERFYVRHSIYDKDHLLHQVLYQALKLVREVSGSMLVRGKAERLLLDFPDVQPITVTADHFNRIPADRKSDRYAQALLIAKMLLLNYRPDITGGGNHVLALLFDMNRLWEEYVYRQLLLLNPEWDISRQSSVEFWKPEKQTAKTLRPDLVINNHKSGRIVIDTKWKMLDDDYPADADLQQLFAYAHYFKSRKMMLLYPGDVRQHTDGRYQLRHVLGNGPDQQATLIECSLLKVPLIWEDESFRGLELRPGDFG